MESDKQVHKIYINNLAPSVTEYMILTQLKKCGRLKSLSFKTKHRVGRNYGIPARSTNPGSRYVFAEFFTRSDAKKAIDLLHNLRMHGRPLTCTFAAAKIGITGAKW